MPIDDEPVLDRTVDAEGAARRPLASRIRHLVTTQPYGVLCTHGQDHAYGSLVAFAFTDDLRTAVFATPVATRKYRLLTGHRHVALVVDNRAQEQEGMMKVEAVTATGLAAELGSGPRCDELTRLLVARHPQLKAFATAESSALFEITIARFFHVSRFQEVNQWVPGDRS